MKQHSLLITLAFYVGGLLLAEACSPYWAILPVVTGIGLWLTLRRWEAVPLAFLLSLGMLSGERHQPTPDERSPWAISIAQRAEQRLTKLGVSDDTRALAMGMLMGDKSQLDASARQEMRQAGMSHLLAVSGLHVGVIWMLVGGLLAPLRLIAERLVGGAVVSGEMLHQTLVLLALWGYIVLVGAPPSALRAGIMITLVTLNGYIAGQANGWHCLIMAALGLLVYDPSLLWQTGFQLSFLAVTGILFFSPILNDHDQPSWLRLLMLTFSAQLLTAPVVAYTFHTVPVMGWIQGLLVVPLLPLYLSLIIAGLLLPQWSWLAWLIDLGTIWIRQVATWTTCLEEYLLGGHLMLYPTLQETLLSLAVTLGLVIYWRRNQRKKSPVVQH